MVHFVKSFKKELGKATGRRVANAVFGDKHASKHKVIIQREREERKREREAIKAEKKYDKELRQEKREQERQQREYEREQKRAEIEERKKIRADIKAQKEEEKEYKRWLKEQERLEKEAELEENQNEFDAFVNYIEAIQSIHKIPVDHINWEDYLIWRENFIEDFKWYYQYEVFNDSIFNYQNAILHLAWLVATIDKGESEEKYATKEENQYLETIAKNEGFEINWESFNSQREILDNDHDQILDESIRALSKSPMIFKIKSLGYMKKMAWVSKEDDEYNNMSDKEWDIIMTTSEKLHVPFKLLRLTHKLDYIDKSLDFVSKAQSPFEEIKNWKEIPQTRPDKHDSFFREELIKSITTPLRQHIDLLIEDGNEKYGANWVDIDYHQKIEFIDDQLIMHYETIKDDSFISNLLFKKKIDTAKNEIVLLEKEKEILTKTQNEKTEIVEHIIVLNDIDKQLEQESDESISYWNDSWTKELEKFRDRIHQHEIASKVINKDVSIYSIALKQVDRLVFAEDFGSTLSISFMEQSAELDFYVDIKDIVPIEKKTITQGRKLSTKPYTNSERNDIIQDYVCSSILRIAKEIFTALPTTQIIIHAVDQISNTATGNFEDGTLISVIIYREKFNNLNLDLIDPSDAIEGFKHNMKFNKSNGFKPVEKLKLTKSKIKSTSKKTTKKVEEQFDGESDIIKSTVTNPISIRFSSSLTVKDIQNQFKELFNKDVIILTPKGNTAGENRKLRALTEKDLKTEIIVPLEKLTKKGLKEVKKLTGIHIDY
jgi:hypothetical protein